MKPLLDLNKNECRWPVEAGGFCAARKAKGSYCAEHHALAYKQTKGATTAPFAPDPLTRRKG